MSSARKQGAAVPQVQALIDGRTMYLCTCISFRCIEHQTLNPHTSGLVAGAWVTRKMLDSHQRADINIQARHSESIIASTSALEHSAVPSSSFLRSQPRIVICRPSVARRMSVASTFADLQRRDRAHRAWSYPWYHRGLCAWSPVTGAMHSPRVWDVLTNWAALASVLFCFRIERFALVCWLSIFGFGTAREPQD